MTFLNRGGGEGGFGLTIERGKTMNYETEVNQSR